MTFYLLTNSKFSLYKLLLPICSKQTFKNKSITVLYLFLFYLFRFSALVCAFQFSLFISLYLGFFPFSNLNHGWANFLSTVFQYKKTGNVGGRRDRFLNFFQFSSGWILAYGKQAGGKHNISQLQTLQLHWTCFSLVWLKLKNIPTSADLVGHITRKWRIPVV